MTTARLRALVVILSCLTLFTRHLARGQESATHLWTNLDGREMKARLLRATDEEATFLLPNGKRAQIPLEQLVKSDRERIQRLRSQGSYWTKAPRHHQWPNRVDLNWLQAKVQVVKEDREAERYIYRTPHYEFHADAKLAPNLVKDFSRIFEVTHEALAKNPLGLKLYQPESGYFKIKLFKSTIGYRMAGGPSGSAGVYSTDSKHIMVPFRSLGLRQANEAWVRRGGVYDPTTLIHEATHQLLDHWLDVAPIWFNEGFADLVGSANYDSGQLFFNRLETGMKTRIRGAIRKNTIVKDLGPSGMEFPLNFQSVLLAPQRQFMGYPPAPKLPHEEVLHHYHSSMVLVHFFLNDGEQGARRLRQYLDTYRNAVTAKKLHELEGPDKVRSEEDLAKLNRIVARRMVIQRNAAKKAFLKLSNGRSDEALFEAMTQFYRERGIHLKPRV